jgi:hypothetical protein
VRRTDQPQARLCRRMADPAQIAEHRAIYAPRRCDAPRRMHVTPHAIEHSQQHVRADQWTLCRRIAATAVQSARRSRRQLYGGATVNRYTMAL